LRAPPLGEDLFVHSFLPCRVTTSERTSFSVRPLPRTSCSAYVISCGAANVSILGDRRIVGVIGGHVRNSPEPLPWIAPAAARFAIDTGSIG